MSNKPNTGALFKNDKEGNDKRPDYKGPLDINGEEWIVAAWLETSRAGVKYLSLKAEPKRQQGSGPPPADGFDDSIPFAPW